MIVVADTSPLNYLIRLGYPDLLHEIYGRVLAPHAVLIEMQHPEAPPEVRAWAFAAPTWLEEIYVRQLDATLAAELGAGEREAISLALQVHADVLLIDERFGRQEAEVRHIEVAGTLAVLLQAGLRGFLDFSEVMKHLRQIGFRVSQSIEVSMLARYEQARKTKP
jgi:predicted nucleic acid-binding protein